MKVLAKAHKGWDRAGAGRIHSYDSCMESITTDSCPKVLVCGCVTKSC